MLNILLRISRPKRSFWWSFIFSTCGRTPGQIPVKRWSKKEQPTEVRLLGGRSFSVNRWSNIGQVFLNDDSRLCLSFRLASYGLTSVK